VELPDTITPCLAGIAAAANGIGKVVGHVDTHITGKADEVLERKGQYNVELRLMTNIQSTFLDVQRKAALLKDAQKLWVAGLISAEEITNKRKAMVAKFAHYNNPKVT